jgi:hypothetical protein
MGKWFLILLVIAGLFFFGRRVHQAQRQDATAGQTMPVSVAAVRGGSQPGMSMGGNSLSSDYVTTMESNADQAQKAVDKYNAAAQKRMNDASNTP